MLTNDQFRTTDLSSRAMLVSLNVTRWTGRRTDRNASDRVTDEAGAQQGTARVTKDIIPREVIKPIDLIYNNAVNMLKRKTLPWDDLGQRLLPGELVLDMRLSMDKLRDDFMAEVRKLQDSYAELRIKAHEQLGTLFDETDYPPVYMLERKFTFALNFASVPDGDIRVALPESLRGAIESEIVNGTRSRLEAATASTYHRVHDMLKRVHSIMTADKPRIFDSLGADLAELTALLPALNLTNDPKLSQIADEMQMRFAGVDSSVLRASEVQREVVAQDADEVLRMMRGLI